MGNGDFSPCHLRVVDVDAHCSKTVDYRHRPVQPWCTTEWQDGRPFRGYRPRLRSCSRKSLRPIGTLQRAAFCRWCYRPAHGADRVICCCPASTIGPCTGPQGSTTALQRHWPWLRTELRTICTSPLPYSTCRPTARYGMCARDSPNVPLPIAAERHPAKGRVWESSRACKHFDDGSLNRRTVPLHGRELKRRVRSRLPFGPTPKNYDLVGGNTAASTHTTT